MSIGVILLRDTSKDYPGLRTPNLGVSFWVNRDTNRITEPRFRFYVNADGSVNKGDLSTDKLSYHPDIMDDKALARLHEILLKNPHFDSFTIIPSHPSLPYRFTATGQTKTPEGRTYFYNARSCGEVSYQM